MGLYRDAWNSGKAEGLRESAEDLRRSADKRIRKLGTPTGKIRAAITPHRVVTQPLLAAGESWLASRLENASRKAAAKVEGKY